jgi:ABC-type multidrug transport system fused ATPase/permease subunit
LLIEKAGAIIEYGSHKELMAIDSGTYRELYELQAGSFAADD